MTKMRVAILPRVIQDYRVSVYERLSQVESLHIKVFHGCDVKGTKLVNSKKSHSFASKEMFSIPIRISTSNGKGYSSFSPFVFIELLRFSPDVVVVKGASNFLNGMQAQFYAWLFRRKVVQWSLGEISKRKKSWHRRVMDPIIHFLERRSEACLTYSSVGKAYYERLGIDSHKIFVALNVVDTEQRLKDMACFDRSLLYRDIHSRFDFVVLYVGVLTKEKKVDVLLKAFAELEKFVSQEVCLLIVGKGEDDARLRSLAREWNIRNIQFVGEQRDGVSQYFFKADVMVLPGLGGLAISDALLHGVPVIATAGDGCEVDLINKNNGVLDEDLNEERLCGYLKKMCEDQPYKQRLKSHAQDIINNRYNIHTYVQGWVDCLSFVQPVMTRKS